MRILLSCLLLLPAVWAGAQNSAGYRIEGKVEGWKDTTVYLGYYFGDRTYLKDTARVRNGGFTFAGKKKLPPGVYFLVAAKNRLVDFLVSDDQFFRIETKMEDYGRQLRITGDADNELFLAHNQFVQSLQKEAEPLLAIARDSLRSEPDRKKAREDLNALTQRVHAYQDDLFLKHPASLTARFLKATRDVEVPDPPLLPNGHIDSTFQWRYYRQHFFDHFDLADDALLRLPRPFYQEKIKEYLERLFVPDPDTIAKAIARMARVAKKNEDTYKYLIWNCVFMYQNPSIMGLDKVYVHLYDTYFASGEMDFWIDARTKQNLKEHADKLRMSLIGNTGANLVMLDAQLQARALYDIKTSYTILYFFNPDCGQCKIETPKLVEFYEKNKRRLQVEVFAICTDTSMQKMKDYIKESKMTWITVNGPRSLTGNYQKQYDAFATPTLYVLDNRKKIIAKKLPAEKLEDFLQNYERRKPAPAGQKGG